jgi:hypothetical protein
LGREGSHRGHRERREDESSSRNSNLKSNISDRFFSVISVANE